MCVVVALVLAQSPSSELDQALAVLDRIDALPLTLDYHQETVQEILDDLNVRLKTPVRADWPALSRLGVDPDDRITLHLNPTIASAALGALTLTMGDEFERPTFEVNAGQLVLTTLAGTAAMRLTGLYDVRDLLADAGLMTELRQSDPPAPPPAPGSTGKSAHDDNAAPPTTQKSLEHPEVPPPPPPAAQPLDPDGPLWGRGLRNRAPALPTPKMDDLIKDEENRPPPTPGEQLYLLITDHVDPEAWMNFGGDRALVSERDGVLIITAAPTTHRRFKQALDALRRANPATLAVEAMIIDLPRAGYERITRQHSSNSAAMVAALHAETGAIILWRSADAVALGARLDVESTSKDAAVHVAFSPQFDKDAGLLRMDVEAGIKQGDDMRSLKTSVALPGDTGAAILELPPANRSDSVRLLMLVPQRR